MARLGVPLSAQTVAGVVLLDFSVGYLSHRTLHLVPILWRFHRTHHSDDFVDVTTTYRTHPVETVWRFLFAIVPVWIIGIPAQAVVIQRLLQVTNGILEHANIRLWGPLDRVMSLVWVTPNVHKIHHSRALAETNSNYGNVLSIYDRILGTFTPSERAVSVVYGLDDADPVLSASFRGLLSMPFQKRESARRASVPPSILRGAPLTEPGVRAAESALPYTKVRNGSCVAPVTWPSGASPGRRRRAKTRAGSHVGAAGGALRRRRVGDG